MFEAMRYSSLGGGKRLRAFFVLAGATLFKVGADARQPARRQRHRVRARLFADPRRPAGDGRRRPAARQAHAATSSSTRRRRSWPATPCRRWPSRCWRTRTRTAIRRCAPRWSSELAKAAGAHGMVGGQMLDLLAEEQGADMSIGAITRLQRLKTGALISFSCTAGAILGKAAEPMRAALVGLCPRSRPRLPDRRRPARRRGRRRRARQDAGQGRRGRQGDLRVDPGRRARPRAGRACWRDRRPRIWSRSARPADLLRQAANSWSARRA